MKVALILKLSEHGYPPVDRNAVYKGVFERAENIFGIVVVSGQRISAYFAKYFFKYSSLSSLTHFFALIFSKSLLPQELPKTA